MTDFRQIYGLPERYFLSLGRMVPKKNLATLVAAYSRYCDEWRVMGDETDAVRGERLKVQGEDPGGVTSTAATSARSPSPDSCRPPPALVLVGSGEEESALQAQARALGLEVVDRREAGPIAQETGVSGQESGARNTGGGEDTFAPAPRHTSLATRHKANCGTVCFYGFRQIEENPIFYALAEAFILPSLYEEWGLVVNEAMACSLPVIVSRTAGCAEDLVPASGQVTSDEWRVTSGFPENCKLQTANSLEPRSNGFVFDPTSVEALAEALALLAANGDARHAMGRQSLEIIGLWGCDNFARQALRAAASAQEN